MAGRLAITPEPKPRSPYFSIRKKVPPSAVGSRCAERSPEVGSLRSEVEELKSQWGRMQGATTTTTQGPRKSRRASQSSYDRQAYS